MSITAEQRGFANGYAKCFLAYGMADNMDLDHEGWVITDAIDYRLHFVGGLVVVDAYKGNDRTPTGKFTRLFSEGEA